MTFLKCDRLIYKDLIVHVIKREDLHVNFPPLIRSGQPWAWVDKMLWLKTCHKHVGVMHYVRINKIKSMGNKILVLVGWEKKKKECVWLFLPPPHCRECKKENKKKVSIFFHFSWPNVLRRKGNKLCSLVLLGRIERRREEARHSVFYLLN